MNDTNGTLPAGHVFEGVSAFHGLVEGDASVASGARLTLHGMIGGNLRIQDGAEVEVRGMVTGLIVLDAAKLDVHGDVGEIVHSPASRVWISPDGHVGGRRHGGG